jgi:murein DD-endopeptidase MepM/ murein hydrolase activator NlpD
MGVVGAMVSPLASTGLTSIHRSLSAAPIPPRETTSGVPARTETTGTLRQAQCGARPAACSVPTSTAPLLPATPPGQSTIDYTVRRGDTFAGIFVNHGLSAGSAGPVFRLMRGLGLASLLPGDSVVMTVSEGGGLTRVSLLSRMQAWYHMTVDGAAVTGEKHVVPVASHLRLARGEVSTSLAEALYSMGVGDAIVAQFTDIFAWDINFFLDPRAGDTFEILFTEKFAEGHPAGYGSILAATYVNAGRRFCALAVSGDSARVCYYDEAGRSVQKEFLKAPLHFSRISSRFTYRRRHPVLGIVRPHLGIDYAAPAGTPICAAADGIVVFAGVKGDYGRAVQIRHGGSYETYYGHLGSIGSGIRAGARVTQGQHIGTVGSTGLSTGPHLDYRISRNGSFVNPLALSMPSKEGITAARMEEFQAIRCEYEGILGMRFPHRVGAFLVEIDIPQAQHPLTLSLDSLSHATTPGS